ncbi:MAG: immunoglobulin domain-containing protein, partial [Verrucomicrobiota bacterium]
TSSNFLARLLPSGAVDPEFNVPLSFANSGGYGDLVLQGTLPLISEPDAQSIINSNVPAARFQTNGALDSSFSPAVGVPGAVYRYVDGYIRTVVAGDFQVLAALTNGQLLAAATSGPYPEDLSQFTYHLLRLNPNGALDATYANATFSPAAAYWNYPYLSDSQMNDYGQFPTLQPIRPVAGATVTPAGKTFVWGTFSSINGVARPGIARLLPGGVLDSGFPVGTGPVIAGASAPAARVSSVTIDSFGRIWVTGNFTHWDGVSASGYVRLNPDGTVDMSSQPECSYYAVADYYQNNFSTTITGSSNEVYAFGSHRLSADVWARAITRLIGHAVAPQLTVLGQPQDQTSLVGGTATFGVQATGTAPLSYQWRFNGTELVNGGRISGATDSILTFTNIQTTDAGNYTVVVTNAYGSVTSSIAVLTLVSAPNFTLTTSGAGLPQLHLSGVAGTYCDIQKSTNLVNWTLIGRAVVGAVIDLNQIDPAWHTSPRGFFRVAVASTQVALPPTITVQPVGVEADAGGSARISSTASGSLPLQYQWQFNGTNIADATNAFLVFTNLQVSQAGFYTAIVTNAAGSTISSIARLSVTMPFTYTTNNGAITITDYTGSGGAVSIPNTISGLPVTSIGGWAFYSITSLTSVTIPNSVTSIENGAFISCYGLT